MLPHGMICMMDDMLWYLSNSTLQGEEHPLPAALGRPFEVFNLDYGCWDHTYDVLRSLSETSISHLNLHK